MKFTSQALLGLALLVGTVHGNTQAPGGLVIGTEVQDEWQGVLEQITDPAEYEETQRLALYNQWKVDAEEFIKSHENAEFKLTDELMPTFKIFNTYARGNVCTELEAEKAGNRIDEVMAGLFGANGLDFQKLMDKSTDHYEANGYDRRRRLGMQLKSCNYGYFCRWGSRGRRRLSDSPAAEAKTLHLEDNSPAGLENMVLRLKETIEEQCEGVLSLIAYSSHDIQHDCRVALKNTKCQIDFKIFHAIKYVVDGVETAAEEVIDQVVAEQAPDRRRNLRTR